MIMSYIKISSCAILAVTPTNSDFANSDALHMAGIANPSGNYLICPSGVLAHLLFCHVVVPDCSCFFFLSSFLFLSFLFFLLAFHPLIASSMACLDQRCSLNCLLLRGPFSYPCSAVFTATYGTPRISGLALVLLWLCCFKILRPMTPPPISSYFVGLKLVRIVVLHANCEFMSLAAEFYDVKIGRKAEGNNMMVCGPVSAMIACERQNKVAMSDAQVKKAIELLDRVGKGTRIVHMQMTLLNHCWLQACNDGGMCLFGVDTIETCHRT